MPHSGRFTISIGVAEGTLEDESAWRNLYHRADKALYSAKQRGRDRAVHVMDLETAAPPQPDCVLPQGTLPQRRVA